MRALPRWGRCLVVLGTVLLIVAVCLTASDVLAKGKKGGKKHGKGGHKPPPDPTPAIEAEIAQARTILANLGSMNQGQLSSAMNTIQEINDAASDVKKAREELDAVEDKLIQDQGPDSPVAKAKARFDEAKKELECEKKRVLSSTACEEKLTQARQSSRPSVAIAEVTKGALADDEAYQMALAKHRRAKAVYEQLTSELFKNDAQWNQVSNEIRTAEGKQQELKHGAKNGALRSLPQKLNAAHVAAAARAVIARDEAKLAALRGKKR